KPPGPVVSQTSPKPPRPSSRTSSYSGSGRAPGVRETPAGALSLGPRSSGGVPGGGDVSGSAVTRGRGRSSALGGGESFAMTASPLGRKSQRSHHKPETRREPAPRDQKSGDSGERSVPDLADERGRTAGAQEELADLAVDVLVTAKHQERHKGFLH